MFDLHDISSFMRFVIESPTRAIIENATENELNSLKKELTYTNTAVQHLVKRWANNHWAKRNNIDAWKIELDRLKSNVVNTLVFQDEKGRNYIRPGSLHYLDHKSQIVNQVKYPTPKAVPWTKMLPFELYDYQKESVQKLIDVKHGNVALTTGSGKSAILLKYCRETGFRTAIVAPSTSIFNELLEKFEYHLGKGQVGRFGDGKKVLGKRFTICIGDSLVNIKPGTEEWEFFSGLDAIAIDESHTFGAETLEDVCHGLFANIPYRVLVSATQVRNDGALKLLQSIIGPTVHTLTTAEAITKGYICDHDFRIVEIESSNPNYQNSDAIKMKRAHFLNNRNIAHFIAKFVNATAAQGKQTLVLVQELSQIGMLIKLLRPETTYAYAHSQTSKKDLALVGLVPVDRADAVERFNKNEIKVLIGTSCIATGTNIFPMLNTVAWTGGSSEVSVKQGGIGRSVRLHSHNPWKDRCLPKDRVTIWDFDVYDVPALKYQMEKRIEFYSESGTEIKTVKLK